MLFWIGMVICFLLWFVGEFILNFNDGVAIGFLTVGLVLLFTNLRQLLRKKFN